MTPAANARHLIVESLTDAMQTGQPGQAYVAMMYVFTRLPPV